MKLRPLAWFIIVANAYFIISFFADYDVNADATANGIGLMVLVFWLAMMNTFLYVIFRITARQKNEKPKSLEFKLKEIDQLRDSGVITSDEYQAKRKSIIENN
jgi:uncharacterized membrane protein